MARRQKKRNAPRALLIALLFLALAVVLIAAIPRAVDSSRATQIPTPGSVTLPPTAPAAPTATVTVVATATSK
jgi:hypothetical protein